MRQKLAIARALLHEPEVLFLDEPTSGLDPQASRLVREFIADLKSAGRTIVLCTHNLDEADRLCDRVAVLSGRLLALDTPSQLRRDLFGRQVVFHLVSEAVNQEQILEGLPGVDKVEAIENKLLVSVDDPERRNPELIRVLVENGVQIQFVGELKRRLEDVYLELVMGAEEEGDDQD
jgi:ABC-2 type transport system ATP-binding protein